MGAARAGRIGTGTRAWARFAGRAARGGPHRAARAGHPAAVQPRARRRPRGVAGLVTEAYEQLTAEGTCAATGARGPGSAAPPGRPTRARVTSHRARRGPRRLPSRDTGSVAVPARRLGGRPARGPRRTVPPSARLPGSARSAPAAHRPRRTARTAPRRGRGPRARHRGLRGRAGDDPARIRAHARGVRAIGVEDPEARSTAPSTPRPASTPYRCRWTAKGWPAGR